MGKIQIILCEILAHAGGYLTKRILAEIITKIVLNGSKSAFFISPAFWKVWFQAVLNFGFSF